MINFKVDQEKCTQCKKCVIDCPVLIIDGKTTFPTIKEGKEENCLKCQHCLAICPEAAISIWDKVPENSIPANAPIPASKELENLLQNRRSIRRFKKDEVSKDLIHHLVAMASYAPTAKNENAVQFTVVDTREAMEKVRQLTYDFIKKVSDEGRLPQSQLHLLNFQNVWEAKNVDVLFRNAPHLVIFSAPKSCTSPVIDCTIAATSFELLAASNGIGTLWDGFAKNALEDLGPEIKADLGIPEDHLIATVMIFGNPAVKYARSVQNDQPNIKVLSW